MKNLFAATYAPFKENGEVNLERINDYADFLDRNGVSGAFVNGSTGDFVSLSTEERVQIFNAWAAAKKDGFRLFNHVGHTSVKEAQRLARESVGKADAIAAIAPYYFKPASLDLLLMYCQEIAQSAPDIPFYYYHLPVLTGVNFPMDVFAREAAKRIPTFKGIKFTENNLLHYKALKNAAPDVDAFFGVDEAFLPSLSVEASGWVGSTYNQLAPLYQTIGGAFNEGDLPKANTLQNMAVQFVQTLDGYGSFNGGGKSFMRQLGVDCGPSRYPHPTLDQSQLKEAAETFKKLGISEYFSR